MAAALWFFLGIVGAHSEPGREAGLFYGYQGCLAVAENQSLSEGEQLIILAAGVGPTETRVGTVRTPSEGSDCWNAFRGEQPSRLSVLSLPSSLRDEVFFGIRSRETYLILAGAPVRRTREETERWARAVSSSVSNSWRAADVLAQAYRYDGNDGKATAVELYLGLPLWNPRGTSPPIKSVNDSAVLHHQWSTARKRAIRAGVRSPGTRRYGAAGVDRRKLVRERDGTNGGIRQRGSRPFVDETQYRYRVRGNLVDCAGAALRPATNV